MAAPRRQARTRRAPALTARQIEVVGLIARGYTNKEIGAALGITERGVSAHVSRLCAKFGAPNRAGLIGRVIADAGFGLAETDRPPLTRLGIQAHIALQPGQELEVYRHAPFLVMVTEGPDHRYTFVNDAAQRVSGMSTDLVLGKPARTFVERGDGWLSLWDRAFTSGRPSYVDAMRSRWKTDDGTWREGVFGFVIQPLVAKDGRVHGLLHIGAVVD